jgi:hypothetical protein
MRTTPASGGDIFANNARRDRRRFNADVQTFVPILGGRLVMGGGVTHVLDIGREAPGASRWGRPWYEDGIDLSC